MTGPHPAGRARGEADPDGHRPGAPAVEAPGRATRVVLGNRDARSLVTVAAEVGRAAHDDDGDDRYVPAGGEFADEAAGTVQLSTPAPGRLATLVLLPDGTRLGEAFTTVTAPGGAWAANVHTPGASPAWVASDNGSLAALLAEHYGCEVRELDEAEVATTFGAAT